jgi:hypothetical protein
VNNRQTIAGTESFQRAPGNVGKEGQIAFEVMRPFSESGIKQLAVELNSRPDPPKRKRQTRLQNTIFDFLPKNELQRLSGEHFRVRVDIERQD